mgnify:CR=1 FL=1|tara:strand:- start:2404 stop:3135 length:732 start_codon:yes stop_codon:yes gene_type:complete
MIKFLCILILVVLVCACSGQVKHEVGPVAVQKTQLDGIWVGSFDIRGRGPYDFYAIHVGERSTAVSHKAKAMCVGEVMQDEDFYYARYSLYALDGSPFDYARLTGEIKEGQIQSHFTTLNGGDTGRMQLDYSDLYEQPSSLALLEGRWGYTDRDGLTYDLSIENGAISGTDSDECQYAGNVTLINPRYNAYDVMLQISNCDSVDGKYEGLSYLDKKEMVYFRMDVGNASYGFHFDFEKTSTSI